MDNGGHSADLNHRLEKSSQPTISACSHDSEQRLALLCGHSKAKVLLALTKPTTTTELAKRIHNSPSAVSQILHRLLRAGFVQQRRQGRQVLYWLSLRGQQLLGLF